MKALLFLCLILTAFGLDSKDALIVVDGNKFLQKSPQIFDAIQKASQLYDSISERNWETVFPLALNIIEDGIPLIQEISELITINYENIKRDFSDFANLQLMPTYGNFICMNICINCLEGYCCSCR